MLSQDWTLFLDFDLRNVFSEKVLSYLKQKLQDYPIFDPLSLLSSQ